MDAPVFKIGGRLRKAGCGGFDSHPLPFISDLMVKGAFGIGRKIPKSFAGLQTTLCKCRDVIFRVRRKKPSRPKI